MNQHRTAQAPISLHTVISMLNLLLTWISQHSTPRDSNFALTLWLLTQLWSDCVHPHRSVSPLYLGTLRNRWNWWSSSLRVLLRRKNYTNVILYLDEILLSTLSSPLSSEVLMSHHYVARNPRFGFLILLDIGMIDIYFAPILILISYDEKAFANGHYQMPRT